MTKSKALPCKIDTERPKIWKYVISWNMWRYIKYFQRAKSLGKQQGKSDGLDSTTGILPKSAPNHQVFGPCDLEIWQMTSKNNREALPCPQKLCVSFHSHPCIWIGITNQKRSNHSKIVNFFALCDIEIWQMTLRHLFYPTSSFKCIISKPSVNSNWSYSPETLNSGRNWCFFLSCVTLKLDRWP